MLAIARPFFLCEYAGNNLFPWHRPPFPPRRFERCLVKLRAGSCHVTIIFRTIHGRHGRTDRLTKSLGCAKQACRSYGSLRVRPARRGEPGKAFQGKGNSIPIIQLAEQRKTFRQVGCRWAIVTLVFRRAPQKY